MNYHYFQPFNTTPFVQSLMKQSSLDEQEQLGMELEAQERENEENDMNDYFRQIDDPMNGGDKNFLGDEAQIEKQNSVQNEAPETPVHPTLPWKPKVRTKDIYQFLDVSRRKFIGYSLQDNIETTAGLPKPICEGINILKKVRLLHLALVLYAFSSHLTPILLPHSISTPPSPTCKSNAKRKSHAIR